MAKILIVDDHPRIVSLLQRELAAGRHTVLTAASGGEGLRKAQDEAPDLVFSQPFSTAAQIAALVLDCAADGKIERARPAFGSMMATVAYVFPSLRRVLKPLMDSIGRRAKARYKAQRA